jgi:glycosyltransferase involved in cell wall biosynthesis
LERQAKAAGLIGRVHFAGELRGAALTQAYASADIFVLPSTGAESFGLVGVEALAAGLPVVAADCGGVREWLVDGQCGRLVAAGNPQALACAIAELLGDPTRRAALGRAGRRLQRERFTQAKHVGSLRALYGELCAQVGVR